VQTSWNRAVRLRFRELNFSNPFIRYWRLP